MSDQEYKSINAAANNLSLIIRENRSLENLFMNVTTDIANLIIAERCRRIEEKREIANQVIN